MMISVHVVWGAALGLLTPTVWALPAGVASHLALDAVPHWGQVPKDQWERAAQLDGVLGLALVASAFAVTPAPKRAAVALGIAGSVLPDLDAPWQYFFKRPFFGPRTRAVLAGIQTEAAHRALSEVQALAAGVVVFAVARSRVARSLQ